MSVSPSRVLTMENKRRKVDFGLPSFEKGYVPYRAVMMLSETSPARVL